jgi:hypothetical protein
MMIASCSISIWQTGINHNFMFSGINEKAECGVPQFLPCLALPEEIGANVCLKPASVDWIYAGFFYRHHGSP